MGKKNIYNILLNQSIIISLSINQLIFCCEYFLNIIHVFSISEKTLQVLFFFIEQEAIHAKSHIRESIFKILAYSFFLQDVFTIAELCHISRFFAVHIFVAIRRTKIL